MAPSRTLPAAALSAVLVLLPAARAAEVDKLLPPDTGIVVTVNVRQILDSPLVKKHGLQAAREALKSNDEVNQILEELGFDPFKDLDRITAATPTAADKDRGLVIVRGRFDVAKFKSRAEEAARDNPDALKIVKVGGKAVYEVSLPGQDDPLFVALLNNTTLVASPGKDYVKEAIDKESGNNKAGELKDKDLRAVLGRLDDGQSVSVAAVGGAFKGRDLGDAGEALEKVDAVGGGLTVTDEVKLEVVLAARSDEDAAKIKETVNNGINSGIALLGLAAGEHKGLEHLLDVLKSVKAVGKGKTVTLKARLSAETLEEIFKDEK